MVQILPQQEDFLGDALKQLGAAVGVSLRPKEQSVLEQILLRGKQPSDIQAEETAETEAPFDLTKASPQDVIALVTSKNEADRRAGQAVLKLQEIEEKKERPEKKRDIKRATAVDTRNFKKIDDLESKAEAAQSDRIAIQQQLAASQSGNISQARGALVDYFNKKETAGGKMFAGLLQDPSSKAFENAKEQMTRNLKKTFGANVSTVEFQNFLSFLPSLGEDPEATQYVLEFMDKTRQLDIDIFDSALELEDDSGFLPGDFNKQVRDIRNEKFEAFNSEVAQLREQFGIGPSGQKERFKTEFGEFSREELQAEYRKRIGG